MSTALPPDVQNVLDSLQQAVTAELDRKARLGHYVVIWQDGRAVMQGADAPPASATATATANPIAPAGPPP
ncbi:MAG: hypothetical protein LW834_22220 [Cyanobium sp. 49614_E6]|nr:hypothetical protein [Cyanobium sp. 49614_E6]